MTEYILKKNGVIQFLEKLSHLETLYAPVNDDSLVEFQPVEDPAEITVMYQNTPVPPKKVLFPQTETMFWYVDAESLAIEEPGGNGDTIIFGLRPCDARSFTMLDRLFEGQFSDVYYLQKRGKTTLIGLACTEPGVNCFCTSVGGSPSSTDGLDVLLTDCGNEYAVDVITERGAAIIAECAEFVEAASESHQKFEIAAKAETLIQRKIPIERIKKQLDGLFYDPIWNELARECVGCSICTFLCPTCHCFDIRDEPFGNEGRRVRVWDSCSNPEYTLQASGYNPRPGRMHRTRNRLYHKYHGFPERFGVIACVGCGRCITNCPVNIDILDMLEKIQNL